MVDSKLTATKVALERLGYRVSVTGDGALVTMVNPGDPADGQIQVGDVIKTVDGEAVTLHDQVVTKVRQHKAGDVIAVGFRRGEADKTVSLTSIAGPDGAARIGVQLQTNDLKYDFPVDVQHRDGPGRRAVGRSRLHPGADRRPHRRRADRGPQRRRDRHDGRRTATSARSAAWPRRP